MRIPSQFLLALVLASTASSARAQELVQIVFEGEISIDGGARVELEVGFRSRRDGVTLVGKTALGLHLAARTSAADVALLLERQLTREGAIVIVSPDAARDRMRASLFVDGALEVNLRLGRGLTAQVCLCESAPALVRFLPPKESKEAARFALTSSTEHPHTKDRGRYELAIDLTASLSGEEAADRLTTAAIAKGWTGEWHEHRAWRPQSMLTGARVTGTCIGFTSKGDWRLEIELERDSTR